jgi:hypothetical protein
MKNFSTFAEIAEPPHLSKETAAPDRGEARNERAIAVAPRRKKAVFYATEGHTSLNRIVSA